MSQLQLVHEVERRARARTTWPQVPPAYELRATVEESSRPPRRPAPSLHGGLTEGRWPLASRAPSATWCDRGLWPDDRLSALVSGSRVDQSLIRSEHLAVALSAGTAPSTESEALRELTEYAARRRAD